jgi:hypothetical protein
MQELTVKTETTGTTTIIGNWELRAGSHDTTEHLARGSTYPGNLDAFKALNGTDSASGDAANGYDPAPKMALLSMTQANNSAVAVLEGGDLNGVYALFATQTTGTAGTSDLVLAASNVGADSDLDNQKEVTITATSTGGTATAVLQVMMLYF